MERRCWDHLAGRRVTVSETNPTKPPVSNAFTRPFGVFTIAKQCIPTICCDEADAQIRGYSSDSAMNAQRTKIAVAFFSDKPSIGQKWTITNAVGFAVSCNTGVSTKTPAAAVAEISAKEKVWGTWSASRDQGLNSGATGANVRRSGEGEGRPRVEPNDMHIPGAGGPGGNDIVDLFSSAIQYFTLPCDGVDQFQYFTGSGRSVGLTQTAADNDALSVAMTLAPLYKLCITGTPPSGVVGVPYSFTPTLIGSMLSVNSYSHSIAGQLPPGLSVVLASNITGFSMSIVGTPTAAGDFTFTILLSRRFCATRQRPNVYDSSTTSFTRTIQIL